MLETAAQLTAATADTSEVEWQLDASDLDAVERWLSSSEPHAGLTARPTGRKLIVDHYVDTSDLRLYAAGFAARLRGANGKSEATLKSIVSDGDPDAGLRRRLELNEPIRYALLHSLANARGPVGSRIRQHAAVTDLRVLFTVRTDRRTAIVSSEGRDVGEVALDDTTIEAGDRRASIRRVEVEALGPNLEDVLAPFVEQLRATHDLLPGTSSKFGGGLTLAHEAGIIEGAIPTPGVPTEMRPAVSAPLDTPQLPRLYDTLAVLAEAAPADLPKRALRPASRELPRILKRQFRAFDARVRQIETTADPPATLLHETRIRAKRLRYAAEFATPLYGKRAVALVSALKGAQDTLGLHQDAEVAIADLRTLASSPGAALPPATLFAMGEIAERYRHAQRAQRDELPAVITAVRRRWRRLRSTMQTRQETA
ncbi:MAG: CHAD domain-containing protein [Chloroflexi bacterium]|nr:CHAD domain-containing protein [Chloroflexota bacterium]MDA1147367.1 CHAD domain-containing protein [Chloroflexota bacterium]